MRYVASGIATLALRTGVLFAPNFVFESSRGQAIAVLAATFINNTLTTGMFQCAFSNQPHAELCAGLIVFRMFSVRRELAHVSRMTSSLAQAAQTIIVESYR